MENRIPQAVTLASRKKGAKLSSKNRERRELKAKRAPALRRGPELAEVLDKISKGLARAGEAMAKFVTPSAPV